MYSSEDIRRGTARINLTLPVALLETTDCMAIEQLTTRSDIIRHALLAYIKQREKDRLEMLRLGLDLS